MTTIDCTANNGREISEDIQTKVDNWNAIRMQETPEGEIPQGLTLLEKECGFVITWEEFLSLRSDEPAKEYFYAFLAATAADTTATLQFVVSSQVTDEGNPCGICFLKDMKPPTQDSNCLGWIQGSYHGGGDGPMIFSHVKKAICEWSNYCSTWWEKNYNSDSDKNTITRYFIVPNCALDKVHYAYPNGTDFAFTFGLKNITCYPKSELKVEVEEEKNSQLVLICTIFDNPADANLQELIWAQTTCPCPPMCARGECHCDLTQDANEFTIDPNLNPCLKHGASGNP